MIKNFKWLLLVSLTFVACNSDDAVVVVSNSWFAGVANFSKYVALGNSLTSVILTLFIEGQKYLTNIMAEQFKAVGGGEFKIPFMADNIGGFKINGTVVGPRLARQEEELQLQWQELLQQIFIKHKVLTMRCSRC
jgi:hypothetical protein